MFVLLKSVAFIIIIQLLSYRISWISIWFFPLLLDNFCNARVVLSRYRKRNENETTWKAAMGEYLATLVYLSVTKLENTLVALRHLQDTAFESLWYEKNSIFSSFSVKSFSHFWMASVQQLIKFWQGTDLRLLEISMFISSHHSQVFCWQK